MASGWTGLPVPNFPGGCWSSRRIRFCSTLSIRDNILPGAPGASDEDLRRTLDKLALGPWLATLADGLETPVGQRGEPLSVGERQLVALARTAVADPDLVVLDEATSGVDPATDAAVRAPWPR